MLGNTGSCAFLLPRTKQFQQIILFCFALLSQTHVSIKAFLSFKSQNEIRGTTLK